MIKAVVGILQKNNQILVAQRPEGKPYSGYWEFPGGKIETHESGEQALKRELHEELGIEVNEATFLFHHSHAYPDKMVLLEIWRVTAFNGEPMSRENQALHWIAFGELSSLALLEGNIALIDKLVQFNY